MSLLWKPALRRWLVSTSVPPVSWLYRAFYGVLIRYAAWRLSRFRGTEAVYLRRGLTGAEFVAGLSDIDLTVIGEWGEAERHGLLEWYARLSRWIPLYDPTLGAYTPAECRRLYRTSYHHQFRFTEGLQSWKLLYGADRLQELEPLPWERLFGGLHTEMKAWWCRFGWWVYPRDAGVEDRAFRNNLCYKAAAEVLRLDLALQERRLASRREALERARQTSDGEAATYLDRLRRCAARRCLHYEGPLVEETQKFLLGHLDRTFRRISSHPSLEPAAGVAVSLDASAGERFRSELEEAAVSRVVEHARTRWAGCYRAAYLASGLSFAMDELLVFLETQPGHPPTVAQVRELVCVYQEATRGARRRVNVFLLLETAAYQICGCELTKAWQALLAPWANPDVFLALAHPQGCLDGPGPRPAPRIAWTRPVADLVAEEGSLFREALDHPVVYKANTLDFLRMFWKYLQLNAVAASAAAGEAGFPQTLPAVRRALARHVLPQPPFLDRFEEAYRRELEGVQQDLSRLLAAAVSYLRELPYER